MTDDDDTKPEKLLAPPKPPVPVTPVKPPVVAGNPKGMPRLPVNPPPPKPLEPPPKADPDEDA
jgi:hypothetical protein